MLVLSRKLNEKITIGENITITVVRVSGNTIRLGIDAPRDVRVVRGELEATAERTGRKDHSLKVLSDEPSVDPEPKPDDTNPSVRLQSGSGLGTRPLRGYRRRVTAAVSPCSQTV